MAEDTELGATEINFGDDEELDTGAAQEAPGEGAEGAEGGESQDDEPSKPAPSSNRWDRMKSALDTMGRGEKVRLPGEPEPENEEESDDEETDEREDTSRAQDSKPTDEGKDGKSQERESDADSSRQAFTITDADGDEAELEWPDGATISFKADGQQVVAKSFGELVTFAQKGVHADRRLSELGKERSQFERRASQLEKQVAEKDAEVQSAEDILLRAVFDDEAREELQKQLASYRDPTVREQVRKGQAAERENERRKQEDQERSTATSAQAAQQFRERVRSEAQQELEATNDDGSQKYVFLTADDIPQIEQRFIDNYRALRAEAQRQYRQQASAAGLTEAQADLEAERWARTYLTEDNLRKVVQEIEEHYRERAARPNGRRADGGKPAGKTPTDRSAAADAERHNNHVKRKLEQRNRNPRPIRGGGADPAGGKREINTEGMTFAQRMEAMRRELHKA